MSITKVCIKCQKEFNAIVENQTKCLNCFRDSRKINWTTKVLEIDDVITHVPDDLREAFEQAYKGIQIKSSILWMYYKFHCKKCGWVDVNDLYYKDGRVYHKCGIRIVNKKHNKCGDRKRKFLQLLIRHGKIKNTSYGNMV